LDSAKRVYIYSADLEHENNGIRFATYAPERDIMEHQILLAVAIFWGMQSQAAESLDLIAKKTEKLLAGLSGVRVTPPASDD